MTKSLPSRNGYGPRAVANGGLDPDILALNLSWLLKAREAAGSDLRKAAWLFGLDGKAVAALRDASILELQRLAQSPLLLFRPRFHVQFSPD
ncbi:MAG: hypothetical protein WCA32_05185 [Chromatiaceae bacterium]